MSNITKKTYNYETGYPIDNKAGSKETQNTAWQKVILEFERIYRLINSEFSYYQDLITDKLDNYKQDLDDKIQNMTDLITNNLKEAKDYAKSLYNELKTRLDGKEFVKSKDKANDIQLKWNDSTKATEVWVDGVKKGELEESGGTFKGVYTKMEDVTQPVRGYSDSFLSVRVYKIPYDGFVLLYGGVGYHESSNSTTKYDFSINGILPRNDSNYTGVLDGTLSLNNIAVATRYGFFTSGLFKIGIIATYFTDNYKVLVPVKKDDLYLTIGDSVESIGTYSYIY